MLVMKRSVQFVRVCLLSVLFTPDCFTSLWPPPVVTPSASNAWSAVWTTTPTALCAKRICLRYRILSSQLCNHAKGNEIQMSWLLCGLRMSSQYLLLFQYLATRGYNKTLLMEEVLQRYLGDELAERKKIHEEEMKELSKSVSVLLNTLKMCLF